MRVNGRECWAGAAVALAFVSAVALSPLGATVARADEVVDLTSEGAAQDASRDADESAQSDLGRVAISYQDREGSTKELAAGEWHDLRSSAADIALEDGWHVATGDRAFKGRALCQGTVRLILCKGAMLQFLQGIEVAPDATLEIYGQEDGAGTLTCDCRTLPGRAGIGSSVGRDSGTVIVYGGRVSAYGGSQAAGIGSGGDGRAGGVIVKCGRVEAYGGEGAAGIGGGSHGDLGFFSAGSQADVEAVGGAMGAGIGGGAQGACLAIRCDGGKIRATGGTHGAGIGGGDGGDCMHTEFNQVRIDAFGGEGAAAIGGGYGGSNGFDLKKANYMRIERCIINATSKGDGAAIGGGWNGDGGMVDIIDSTVEADGYTGDGIGGGSPGHACTVVNIHGSSVTAKSEQASGIATTCLYSSNASIKAVAGCKGTAIGGGFEQGFEPSLDELPACFDFDKAGHHYGYLSFCDDIEVDACGSVGGAIGRGFYGGGASQLYFGKNAKVFAVDDEGEHLASIAERSDCCMTNKHVKISSKGL